MRKITWRIFFGAIAITGYCGIVQAQIQLTPQAHHSVGLLMSDVAELPDVKGRQCNFYYNNTIDPLLQGLQKHMREVARSEQSSFPYWSEETQQHALNNLSKQIKDEADRDDRIVRRLNEFCKKELAARRPLGQ